MAAMEISMNDRIETEEDPEPSPPLSEIQIFLIKVAAVTGAVFFLFVAAFLFLSSQAEELTFLKGGHAFWEQAEAKLYRMADEPDLPEPKKAKIIAALRKLADKYRPYVDALQAPEHK
jgi:hypothetical protein